MTVTDGRINRSRVVVMTDSRNGRCDKCGETIPADKPLYWIERHKRGAGTLCEPCFGRATWWETYRAKQWYGHPFHLTPADWFTDEEKAARAEMYPKYGWEIPAEGFLCRCACANYILDDPYWADLFRLAQVTDGCQYSACIGCGRTMGRVYWHPMRTCSRECARIARNERRRVDPQQTECQVCGDTFTPPRADAAYCSSRCRQKAYRQRRSESR